VKKLADIRRRLAAQADYRCGYCLTSERLTGIRLTLDHIIPIAAGGRTEENNLWVACRSCNEFKGVQTHAQDPDSNKRVSLFNHRFQQWHEH
jgi:5-methylcytosine-specific restriction endonuclease McrA